MSIKIGGNENYGCYINSEVEGVCTCNHLDLNCIIGHGRWSFDTEWSRRNEHGIYLYRDPYNIDSIALADDVSQIHQVENATQYDRSQRSIVLNSGQVALLKNIYGFWAAVKVIEIKDKKFGSDRDKFVFRYKIQTRTYHGPGAFPYSFGPNAFPPTVKKDDNENKDNAQKENKKILEDGSEAYPPKEQAVYHGDLGEENQL